MLSHTFDHADAKQMQLWLLFDAMDKAPFTFHLTGSRFFGDYKPSSDWDYFCQYSCNAIKWLKDKGFTLCEQYKDANTVCVYEYVSCYTGERLIHVQLVNDSEKKEHIQASMMKDTEFMKVLLNCLSKRGKKNLWNILYDIAGLRK